MLLLYLDLWDLQIIIIGRDHGGFYGRRHRPSPHSAIHGSRSRTRPACSKTGTRTISSPCVRTTTTAVPCCSFLHWLPKLPSGRAVGSIRWQAVNGLIPGVLYRSVEFDQWLWLWCPGERESTTKTVDRRRVGVRNDLYCFLWRSSGGLLCCRDFGDLLRRWRTSLSFGVPIELLLWLFIGVISAAFES